MYVGNTEIKLIAGGYRYVPVGVNCKIKCAIVFNAEIELLAAALAGTSSLESMAKQIRFLLTLL